MKNKWIAVISALLALLTLLCACAETPAPPAASDTTPAETTGVVAPAPDAEEDPLLELVENKQLKASVVYPENASDAEKAAATEICDWLKETYGAEATLKNDRQPYDAGAVEILVGRTNYTESQDALKGMKYNEWVVKTVGNKVLVCAHLTDGIERANWEFIDYLKYQMEEETLCVEREVVYSGEITNGVSVELNVVPLFDDRYARTYNTGDSCQMTKYANVTVNAFADWEAYAMAAGYRKISSYVFITENTRYAQYASDDTIVTAFYSANDETARVFVEPSTVTNTVPTTAGEYDVISGYVPKLFQVGISDPIGTGDTTYNGECYMILLADGSFVVFDGGLNDTASDSKKYRRQNARRILEIVKAYTPEGKTPTIAAWLVTHGHSDHFGAFSAFDALGYNDIVTVESVIINLPSYEMFDDLSDAASYGDMSAYRSRVQEYVKNGSKLYKAHAGQIFQVRNVDLQIVYSPELRAHGNMTNFNSSSVVTRVVVKDATRSQDLDTIMITGDMYGEPAKVMVALYGEAMHCNLVQMPHHGYYKHDQEGVFWQNVKANYILWPISKEKPDSTPTQGDWHGDVAVWEANYVPWLKQNMFNNDMNSDKIFWALWDTVIFDLPFTGKNFTRTPNAYYAYAVN